MNDVTQSLTAIGESDRRAPEQHLPLVSEEHRRLEARKLACQWPGQTLHATALLHEVYLRPLKRLKDILACLPGGVRERLP